MKPLKMGPIKINLKFSGGASGKVAAICPNGPSSNLRSDGPYPEKNLCSGITVLQRWIVCLSSYDWIQKSNSCGMKHKKVNCLVLRKELICIAQTCFTT